jgi:DNA polymerase-3 subunit beta
MLKVNRETMLEALSVVNQAVAKKASMPVLTHVRLGMEKNRGTVTGTDLENTVIYPIEGNCAKKVDVLLPAKKLQDILKNVQSNERDINVELNNGKASLNHAEINTLPAEEYPVLPDIKKPVRFELRDFEPVIRKALVAAGQSDTRYTLNSVLLDFKNNAVVATDGHRLHKIDFKFGVDHQQVIMPIATAKLIKGNVIKARIDTSCGVFENGRYILSSAGSWKALIRTGRR